MNELTIFNNEHFGTVRTLTEGGRVLFCAADVAKSLGYANTSKAISDHCKGVTKRYIPTTSGTQEMNFISRGDVYRLAARSKLDGAEQFESWLFDEVVPSIHDTGGYIAGQESMTDMELLSKAVLVAQKQIEERNKRIEALEQKAALDAPKVLFADAVRASDTSILVGDLAKLLKQNGVSIGRNRLFKWMRDNGYLIKGNSDKNMPTQRSMERDWMEIVEHAIFSPDGQSIISKTPYITAKGQQYFINLFLRGGVTA